MSLHQYCTLAGNTLACSRSLDPVVVPASRRSSQTGPYINRPHKIKHSARDQSFPSSHIRPRGKVSLNPAMRHRCIVSNVLGLWRQYSPGADCRSMGGETVLYMRLKDHIHDSIRPDLRSLVTGTLAHPSKARFSLCTCSS